jgi:nitric oxide dioxygenase
MISEASRPYIDASVPVLREHGLTITKLFYSNMLGAHPELTRIFNMGNQASGAQQQSLASAVFAYAANIGNPGALGPVVNRIVHKHVSIGIRAEHYPIVGQHLLGAIAARKPTTPWRNSSSRPKPSCTAPPVSSRARPARCA